MPIYEYRCDDCGTEFEALLLRNSPPAVCPECSGSKLTQRISLSRVSSRSITKRNYRSEERRRDKEAIEKARSINQDHGHDHDH